MDGSLAAAAAEARAALVESVLESFPLQLAASPPVELSLPLDPETGLPSSAAASANTLAAKSPSIASEASEEAEEADAVSLPRTTAAMMWTSHASWPSTAAASARA